MGFAYLKTSNRHGHNLLLRNNFIKHKIVCTILSYKFRNPCDCTRRSVYLKIFLFFHLLHRFFSNRVKIKQLFGFTLSHNI